MPTIEIDNEVFAFLQEQAVPFVDDPNAVLRRLLLSSQSAAQQTASRQHSTRVASSSSKGAPPTRDTASFVAEVLERDLGGGFRKCRPFSYLFESADALVYFQNFNQPDSDTLWYRLRHSALEVLRDSSKRALVCLTNPSDGIYYALPMEEVDRRARSAGWNRDDIEVNIDHENRYWRELDWNMDNHLCRVDS